MPELHSQFIDHPPRSGHELDVVGIGAINLDYIASTHEPTELTGSLTALISELRSADGKPLEWGIEQLVDDRTIYAAIEAVSSVPPHTTLGGSAFNAVSAIAQTQVGLRLGYVGVAGRVPVIGVSVAQQLEALGIDHQFVLETNEHLSGICFSFSEHGERTLLTHAGANDLMAGYLERNFRKIVSYLARARIVHVTSFLDDRTADQLLAVLCAAREQNPNVLVSFDPGHVWSSAPTQGVEGLVHISDYVLVNHREFRELDGQPSNDSDDEVAARLLARLSSDRGGVLVKRATGIRSYRRETGKVVGDFYPQVPLPIEHIEDSTGAGDVFAAGFLIALTYERLQVELGSLLGMRLARHKLRYVGTAGHTQFASLTRDVIRSLDAERRSRTGRPGGVFISHGRSPDWLAVQRFIEQRFALAVYTFESASWSGRQVTEALAEYLDRCDFAICVLTSEDLVREGESLARQNVIHEVGLFQGRHGFDRVLVLAEEGCAFVPAMARPYAIEFPHNRIQRTFYQVAEVIRSHGFASNTDAESPEQGHQVRA